VNCLLIHRQFCKWIGLICAVVALFSFAHEAQGTYAYLPMVGAPALRIETATTNSFNYLAFSQALSALEAKTAAAVSNAATLAAAPAAKTNNSGAISYEAFSSAQAPVANNNPINANNPTVFVSAPMPGGGNNSQGSLNFAFPSSTASDLLTVTPQMITQYLKPDANETNQLDRPGAIVFVPADMPFTPPTQPNAPGSRAIYQSR
jgi:hypothetical protein